MSFATDIQKFGDKYEKRCTVLLKKVSLDLFKKVVLKTPVDTGRARGNWMVGVNTIPRASMIGIEKNPMPRIVIDISEAKFGDNVALTNTLPYIMPLEYGGYTINPKSKSQTVISVLSGAISRRSKTVGGFSRQAPQGMVRISIEEYLPTLNKAVALVKREVP